MLKITNSTKKMTPVDKQVRIMAGTILAASESFEDFEELFNKRIKALPGTSTSSPQFDYKLRKEAGKLTIWRRTYSEKPDQLLIVVTEEGKAY